MPDFLTRKVGPLPLWTYGVAAAALVALIGLYRRGQSSMQAQPSAIPASPYASSDQGLLNYPPTVVVTPAGTTNTAPPLTQPSGSPANQLANLILVNQEQTPGNFKQGVPVWDAAHLGANAIAFMPFAAKVPSQGPPLPSGGRYWYPVNVAGGATGYVENEYIAGFGGGAGGPAAIRGGMRGTHHALTHFTPFQPQQFVDGRGGAGAGGAHPIAAIARRTGISEVRLRSLNYHLRRRDGSYGHGIIRVS